jgi:N-acyl-D-aspartate/D-glutamate deacylase
MRRQLVLAFSAVAVLASCAPPPPHPAVIERYGVLIRNGLVYDGSGAPPRRVAVAVNGSRIVALLPAGARADARQVLDAAGKAVAPGFISDRPQQFATGVSDVFVNGVQVLRGGEHTGATPGQVVRGPGWTG